MRKIVYAVEDDSAIRELYTYTLENDFDCACFESGELFFNAVSKRKPDIVLLDVMLPGEDGFAILSALKCERETKDIPVIMISAKGDEISKVKGLNIGAEDYISKPFGVLELVARIKANLRKSKAETQAEKITYKDIVIDSEKHAINVNGKNIQTTLKEYNLLSFLCKHADKVQSREIIFHEVWGDDFIGETRTLDIHIKELRKKLVASESETAIKTIRGVGYMLA
ncbi:MAG: response regulator transcription factor [Defluviitaleaceae bacterium]|nr:response regulator transcription factor [Defluviitaleaceae bacterium]MCL2261792.1 response regulator transcription factor [Defluviitaleaceae bacterium]